MRSGPPRASMKLDNRPKKLLVKDVAPDTVQAIRDWYASTGQVESVDALDSGDVVVAFRSRSAAEQVCRPIRIFVSFACADRKRDARVSLRGQTSPLPARSRSHGSQARRRV
jgi:hypothetical protein